ncbi:hypothetical protein G7046_g1206 [Stylonectria norvegica]|nr:hypothetical protein G7046_g1206 [Stylonectria norvegica]
MHLVGASVATGVSSGAYRRLFAGPDSGLVSAGFGDELGRAKLGDGRGSAKLLLRGTELKEVDGLTWEQNILGLEEIVDQKVRKDRETWVHALEALRGLGWDDGRSDDGEVVRNCNNAIYPMALSTLPSFEAMPLATQASTRDQYQQDSSSSPFLTKYLEKKAAKGSLWFPDLTASPKAKSELGKRSSDREDESPRCNAVSSIRP